MRKTIKILLVILMLFTISMLSSARIEISNYERMNDYYQMQVKVQDDNVYVKSNGMWMNADDYIKNRIVIGYKEPNKNSNNNSRDNCNNRNGDKNVTDHDGDKCDDDIPVPINPLVGIGFAALAIAVSRSSLNE